MYDAILFDFDGVLADTEPIHWACWSHVLAPCGLHLDWETYRACCIGIPDLDVIGLVVKRCNSTLDARELFERLYPLKKARFNEVTLAEPPISAGMIAFVQSLHGYKLAVVTSSGRMEIEPLLVKTGLRPAFDVLLAGEDVTRLKPAPDPYLLAAKLLGAKKALVVEDSPAGLESGRAGGFDILAVPDAAHTPELVRAKLQAG
jgi:beta-phosphoglucomutase